jgi:hypothetical protein
MLLKVSMNMNYYHSIEKVRSIPTQALFLDRSDRDTLHLLVQSPYVLFVYWQLSERKRAMVQEHFGVDWQSLQPTLRIYDITGLSFDGSEAREVSELSLPQGESCFLSEFHPGRVYIADLGIVNELSQFLPLLRSNTVETPLADITVHPQTNVLFPLKNKDQLRPNKLYPLSFKMLKPESYEHFSAYSVYIPKALDTKSGGDSD